MVPRLVEHKLGDHRRPSARRVSACRSSRRSRCPTYLLPDDHLRRTRSNKLGLRRVSRDKMAQKSVQGRGNAVEESEVNPVHTQRDTSPTHRGLKSSSSARACRASTTSRRAVHALCSTAPDRDNRGESASCSMNDPSLVLTSRSRRRGWEVELPLPFESSVVERFENILRSCCCSQTRGSI